MADNETVAAVLAAGTLHPISPPARSFDGTIGQHEQTRFVLDVLHAVALYRAVLELLGQTNIRRVRMVESTPAQVESGDHAVPDRAKAAMSPPPHRAAPVPAPELQPVK